MKSLAITTLVSGFLAFNFATAATLSDAEIFAAIDGENDDVHGVMESRVNYDISASDMSSSHINALAVIKGVDGEDDSSLSLSPTRVNYDVSPAAVEGSIKGLPRTYD